MHFGYCNFVMSSWVILYGHSSNNDNIIIIIIVPRCGPEMER